MTYRRPFPRPRWYTDGYGHKMIEGQTYLGRVRVPPMPNHVILTDRVTGEQKALSHTGDPGSLVIDLATPSAVWTDRTTHGPYEGPTYHNWRLVLSDGVLSFEAADGYNGPLILTRNAYASTVLWLSPDTSGNVVYTEFTL